MKSLKKGFTLVELMVVIVIIGILAALAIPRFLGATNKTKAAEFKPVLKQIYTLQEAYKQEKDAYSNDADGSDIGFDKPDSASARFSYGVSNVGTRIGYGNTKANKIKDVNNQWIPANTAACVDSTGAQSVEADVLGSVSNLPTLAACAP